MPCSAISVNWRKGNSDVTLTVYPRLSPSSTLGSWDIRRCLMTAKDGGRDRLLLRVPEAAERAALSRSKLYELIASGEIRVIHIGRAVRVPSAELERWVRRISDEEGDTGGTGQGS